MAFALFVGCFIGFVVTALIFVEGGKWGFLPLVLFLLFNSLMFFGNHNARHQWENRNISYYPEGQVETVQFQDGSIVQYVYDHDKNRINLTEFYKEFYPEESTYKEVKREGYSWFIFNYEEWIKHELDNKVFVIEANKEQG